MKDLPKGWEWKTLTEISLRKGQYGSGARKVVFNGKVRFVRITDIDENGTLKDDEIISPSVIENDCILEKNDLLFARSGSVGRTYFHVKNDDLKYQFAGYLIRFKINPKVADARYVFYITKSKYYFDWVDSFKRSVTISNINAQEYGLLKIPLPPLSVQKQIVAILDRAEKLKERQKQSTKDINQLFDSLIQKAFNGELVA